MLNQPTLLVGWSKEDQGRTLEEATWDVGEVQRVLSEK